MWWHVEFLCSLPLLLSVADHLDCPLYMPGVMFLCHGNSVNVCNQGENDEIKPVILLFIKGIVSLADLECFPIKS